MSLNEVRLPKSKHIFSLKKAFNIFKSDFERKMVFDFSKQKAYFNLVWQTSKIFISSFGVLVINRKTNKVNEKGLIG